MFHKSRKEEPTATTHTTLEDTSVDTFPSFPKKRVLAMMMKKKNKSLFLPEPSSGKMTMKMKSSSMSKSSKGMMMKKKSKKTDTMAPSVAPSNPGEADEDSPGNVEIVGLLTDQFNPRSSSFSFKVTGETFSTDPEDTWVEINGNPVPPSNLIISPTMITVENYLLANGANEIYLIAVDSAKLLLSIESLVWAGSGTLRVNAIDETSSPVPGRP